MRYSLVFTDIDGTLLNEKREVTQRVKQSLAELDRRAVRVILVTARPPRAATPIYQELGLTGPLIAYNGAMAYEPQTGRTLFSHSMSKELAGQLVAAIRAVAPEVNFGLEMEDDWYVDRYDPRLEDWEVNPSAQMHRFGRLEEALASSPCGVSKLYLFAGPAERAALEARLEAVGVSDQIFVTSSAHNFVEILPAGVNKGSALRAMAAILGARREATLYLGDEEADVPALLEAGLGVAMGNAPDRVKQAAQAVTLPNTEDGWAEAIDAHVLAG